MISKEEIEKAKERIQKSLNDILFKTLYSQEENDEDEKILLQYIDQLEQENNKPSEVSFEFEISEESTKKLHKMFEPLENAYNRFENEEETLDDLLNYYPSFEIQFKYNDDKQKELDVVEKKYYQKLVNIIKMQNKIIDEMAEQLAGIVIFDIEKDEPLILGDKEEVKQYFEKKVE